MGDSMKSGAGFATLLMGAALAAFGPAQAQPSTRVRDLVGKMTLDEKTAFVTGANDPAYRGQSGYAPGVARLGVPGMRWGNGPQGVEASADATGIPSGQTLSATFDPPLARKIGAVIGQEARIVGVDVINGPQVDVSRIANWGRNSSAFSEDPLLAGAVGAAEIQGIQDQGVMATAKHYVVHQQALNIRGPKEADFVVDDRTLHEIYLPPFEAAAKVGVASMMTAYHRLNGFGVSESKAALTGILRDELHWPGFLVTDWGAIRDIGALEAGVDIEMSGLGAVPGENPKYFFGDKLNAAVRAGKVPAAALDRAVTNRLVQMERFGFLDGKRKAGPSSVDVEGHAEVVRSVAAEGAVLLKNDGILPLSRKAMASLAVLGPTAGQLAAGAGNGRAIGYEARLASPLAALRSSGAGHDTISYSLGEAGTGIVYAVGEDQTGAAIPASALSSSTGDGGRGLQRTADGGATVSEAIDFVGSNRLPAGTRRTWRGSLTAPVTGDYLLMTQSWGGSAELKLDGKVIASSGKVPFHGRPRKWTSLLPTVDGLDNGQAIVRLEAGKAYPIELAEVGDTPDPVQVRLAWVTPEMRQRDHAEAVKAAKAADTAVVFAWGRSGEVVNPELNLALPGDQNALIEAVAAANPNTIVVLNTGGPVRMPWLGKVRAVLEMWYPGQEGGWATADVLLGKANPGGKLPITFPLRIEDTPAEQPGHPERYEGVGGKVTLSEGIFVGYRWYDQNKIAPLFPFGHGLSYTTFQYSGLKVAPAGDGADVSFQIRNTGKVRGAEVAQVYLERPAAGDVPLPPRALAGFSRVSLAPGEARAVKVHIGRRQLSYWSTDQKAWLKVPGARGVAVGSSSRDLRLNGPLAATPPGRP
jgi:beta-glucosidase